MPRMCYVRRLAASRGRTNSIRRRWATDRRCVPRSAIASWCANEGSPASAFHTHAMLPQRRCSAVSHDVNIMHETRSGASGTVSYTDRATTDLVMQATSPRSRGNAIPASGKKTASAGRRCERSYFCEDGDAAVTAGVSLGNGLLNRSFLTDSSCSRVETFGGFRASVIFLLHVKRRISYQFLGSPCAIWFASCEFLRLRLLPRSVILPPSSK
jgi:hypothetical protein